MTSDQASSSSYAMHASSSYDMHARVTSDQARVTPILFSIFNVELV